MDCIRRSQGVYLARFSDVQADQDQRYVRLSSDSTNADQLDDVGFLYFIIFSEDYTSYEIYDAKLNLVVERIALIGRHI